jgi:hypothetical protein
MLSTSSQGIRRRSCPMRNNQIGSRNKPWSSNQICSTWLYRAPPIRPDALENGIPVDVSVVRQKLASSAHPNLEMSQTTPIHMTGNTSRKASGTKKVVAFMIIECHNSRLYCLRTSNHIGWSLGNQFIDPIHQWFIANFGGVKIWATNNAVRTARCNIIRVIWCHGFNAEHTAKS